MPLGLDKFSLPVRYGIFGFLGGCIGAVLADVLGFMEGRSEYITIPIAAAIGAAIVGWLKQKRQ